MKFDKSKLPSRHVSVGVKSAPHRSMYHAMGLKKEDIEIFELKSIEVENFIFDENKVITPGAKFALMWWVHNYKKERG